MTRLVGILLVFLVLPVLAMAQTPARQFPLTVNDGVDGWSLTFGLDPGATDGIDAVLGEAELPPVPPTGVMDARFVSTLQGYPLGEGVAKDFRQGTATARGVVIHELSYQVGSGTVITVAWDLPSDVTGRLQDTVDGRTVNVFMNGHDSCQILNPASYPLLRMTIHYRALSHSLRCMLEGPYDLGTGLMKKTLNTQGTLASRFGPGPHPADAVDSVCVEIRNAPTGAGSSVRRFAPAWLLEDGTIRMFSDTAQTFLQFDSADAGDYYVVVFHRNHLAIMSANPVTLSEGLTQYDFTTAQGQAYGTNAMKQLTGGVYGMYAGDANGSGDVTILDRAAWRTQNSLTGYLGADFNLSGDVSILDRAIWRANNSLATQVP